MDLQFEWDEAKATANAHKHVVSFEEAITIFGDSNALTIFDTEHSGLEGRFYRHWAIYEWARSRSCLHGT